VSYIALPKDAYDGKKVVLVGEAIIIDQEMEVERNKQGIIVPTSGSKMGILTAVDLQNGRYVAFAHEIIDKESEKNLEYITCYEVDNLEIQKSSELIGTLSGDIKEDERIGNVIQNRITGVLGIIDDKYSYCENKREISIGSKYKIKKGPATIYVDLDGSGAKEYDIEIQSINYRDELQNIKIKITDEELLEKTGGIVQGMSGTPVLQNGKLIGAINSVTLYDHTEGFATFASSLFE